MPVIIEFSRCIDPYSSAKFEKLIDTLYKRHINYNENIQGEYTYWLDAPIWYFGESNTEKESKEKRYKTSDDMKEIINTLAEYYSPSIILSMEVFGVIIPVNVAIYEGRETWREVSISFEREMAYDLFSKKEKN